MFSDMSRYDEQGFKSSNQGEFSNRDHNPVAITFYVMLIDENENLERRTIS